MLELPYHQAYFLIPAGLWIGVIEFSTGAESLSSFRSKLILIATATVLFFGICIEYLKIEEDFRLARFEYLRIGSLHASRSAPEVMFLSNLAAYSRIYRTVPRVGMSDRELADMEAIVRRYPYGRLLSRYSEALALNGHLVEAKKVFSKIRYLYGETAYAAYREALVQRAQSDNLGLLAFASALP